MLGIVLIFIAGFSARAYHQRYQNTLYMKVFKVQIDGEQTRYLTFGSARKKDRGKVFMDAKTIREHGLTAGENIASNWSYENKMAKTSSTEQNWNETFRTPGTYTVHGNKLTLDFDGTVYDFVFSKKDGTTFTGKATASGNHTAYFANETDTDLPELQPDGHTFTNKNVTFTDINKSSY